MRVCVCVRWWAHATQVVLSGSIVCAEYSPVRESMSSKLLALFPKVNIVIPEVDAEIGAALLIQRVCERLETSE
jgi:hypothetical protein